MKQAIQNGRLARIGLPLGAEGRLDPPDRRWETGATGLNARHQEEEPGTCWRSQAL